MVVMAAGAVPLDDRLVSVQRTEVEIEVRRGLLELEGYCNDYIVAEFDFAENVTTPGTIEVPVKSMWAKWFARCDKENIFIHRKVNGKWWTGRVDKCRKKRKGRTRTVIAELVSDYIWFESMYCYPNNFAPLWAQWPKKNVKLMPTKTMIESYIFEVLFRIQANLYRFPVGFFNDPIKNWWSVKQWMQPCVLLPGDPFHDTTRWNTLLARMINLEQLFKDVCYDEHIVIDAAAFVPGRDEQPSDRITLDKPCIYFNVRDARSVVGRTGTVIDGLFNTIIDTIDPFLQSTIGAFTKNSAKYSLSKFFGTDPTDPWVVIRDDPDDDDIEESEVVINSRQALTGIVGGQSPEWLNKGVNLIVNAAISGVLSAAGVGFLGDLISGELNDVLFAFQSVTDWEARESLGIFALPEAADVGGSSAYTWDAAQALRKIMWEIRPYRTFSVTLNDTKPFQVFKHFDVGDPIGWEDDDDGEIHVDYVRRVTVRVSRGEKAKITIKVGDDQEAKDPMTKALDRIARVKEAFDFWTLSDAGS